MWDYWNQIHVLGKVGIQKELFENQGWIIEDKVHFIGQFLIINRINSKGVLS